MTIILVIIGFSLLILVHELGHFLAAKAFNIKVEKFAIGFPPKLFGKKIGETEYSINLLPFGGFVKIYGEQGEEISPGEESRSFVHQKAWKKAVVLTSGVLMNIILGWLVIIVIFTVGIPEQLVVTDVVAGTPASESGVRVGDIIREAGVLGAELTTPLRSEDFVRVLNEHPNEYVSLTIERGKEIVQTQVFIRGVPPEGQGPTGIAIINSGFPGTPFPENIVKGTAHTVETVKLVAVSFANLIGAALGGEKEPFENITGPVGIAQVAAHASTLGIIYLAELMALISLNLAVLNFIPFPALDGGQLLLLAIEKMKGKPFSYRTKTIVNSAGMAILILLMVMVTIKDVQRVI